MLALSALGALLTAPARAQERGSAQQRQPARQRAQRGRQQRHGRRRAAQPHDGAAPDGSQPQPGARHAQCDPVQCTRRYLKRCKPGMA